MSLADRVIQSMKRLNVTQAEFARAAKISQGYASKIMTGKIKIPKEILTIAKVLKQPVEWLEHGKTPDINRTNSLYSIPIVESSDIFSWLYSGSGRMQFEQELLDMYENGYEKCFAMTVANNDTPALKAGDIVIVNPKDENYQNGDLLVVKEKIQDKFYIKRYSQEGETKFLHSFIPSIPAIKFTDEIQVAGVVVKIRHPDTVLRAIS